MPKLETVCIDIDGNPGNINAIEFDSQVHKLWDPDAKSSTKKSSGDGELKLRTWAELFDFVADTEDIDYDVQGAKDEGKKLAEAIAEVEALL